LYEIIVLSYNFNPEYFWREMDMNEADIIVKQGYNRIKDTWEAARLIAFTTAQCNSTKRLNFNTFMPFWWEQNTEEHGEKLSIEEQEKMYNTYKEKLKNGSK
jgi:hypothetical protein